MAAREGAGSDRRKCGVRFQRAGDAPQFGPMGNSLASENSLSWTHAPAFLNMHDVAIKS